MLNVYSEQEDAAPTYEHGFGFITSAVWCDNTTSPSPPCCEAWTSNLVPRPRSSSLAESQGDLDRCTKSANVERSTRTLGDVRTKPDPGWTYLPCEVLCRRPRRPTPSPGTSGRGAAPEGQARPGHRPPGGPGLRSCRGRRMRRRRWQLAQRLSNGSHLSGSERGVVRKYPTGHNRLPVRGVQEPGKSYRVTTTWASSTNRT